MDDPVLDGSVLLTTKRDKCHLGSEWLRTNSPRKNEIDQEKDG